MSQKKIIITICILIVCISTISYVFYNLSEPELKGHKTVLCIPVYGQSLALGEEATRITDFDSLRTKYNGRIITENLNYNFGYFDHSSEFKEKIKEIIHYQRKAYELSVYGMAEELASQFGNDTLICIFPGGHGMTRIEGLIKPSAPYKKFIEEIERAYKKSKERGWNFYVPAICWMQGESDIVDYTQDTYKKYFMQFLKDINNDIKSITKQQEYIRIISYQTNAITKGKKFKSNNFLSLESCVPETQRLLVLKDTLIWASGPTYPYSFVNENIHINALGQKCIGTLAAKSILGIIRGEKRNIGLQPTDITISNNDIIINFNVPIPPLHFDTTTVSKATNYGFSVITPNNKNILKAVKLNEKSITINCSTSPKGCRIRYAINGNFMQSGNKNGPRGNLRDSQGEILQTIINDNIIKLHNWCFQFDIKI
ncbi:sialate O-acetylesterase [Xylanibacter ruminicola]|uniref:sialate O-acetylesterase n=1 Tax=Xylanibacter ruminicola TaxID=839 RepID=UPI0004919B3C|nr:sialate O-acetylesterase [Xylanibacter ruminicola]